MHLRWMNSPQASVLSILGQEHEVYLAELPRLAKLTPAEARLAVESLADEDLVRVGGRARQDGSETGEIPLVRVTSKGRSRLKLLKRGFDGFGEETRDEELDEAALDQELSTAIASL